MTFPGNRYSTRAQHQFKLKEKKTLKLKQKKISHSLSLSVHYCLHNMLFGAFSTPAVPLPVRMHDLEAYQLSLRSLLAKSSKRIMLIRLSNVHLPLRTAKLLRHIVASCVGL